MKRAEMVLVSILLAASTLGATAQAASAYRGDVWSNSDAFSSGCLGFTDTYPQQMYNLASAQLAKLGYNPLRGALGPQFTTSSFISNVQAPWAIYVHTHGDNYWAASGYPNVDSGILQDPGSGRCNSASRDMIRSSSIKNATAGGVFNLVIMSTCKLGANESTMPGAFQIEKIKSATQREFFLGYVNYTYDSAAFRFEQAFWSYLNGSLFRLRTASQAFTYAMSIGGYAYPDSSNPFQANWWGNPNYNGTPGW
jgi:hypothetical protein